MRVVGFGILIDFAIEGIDSPFLAPVRLKDVFLEVLEFYPTKYKLGETRQNPGEMDRETFTFMFTVAVVVGNWAYS